MLRYDGYMRNKHKNYQDRHHILHHRQEWDLRPESAALRGDPSLIPLIDRTVHEELHRVSPAVPLLSYHVLVRVLNLYEPQRDVIDSMDNLMLTIDHAARHRRAHRVERGIANLAIEALDIQRAVLRGNLA